MKTAESGRGVQYPVSEKAVTAATDAVKDADALLITAGAGMGVDSGLPDFRGNEGFWQAYPPMVKLGLSFVDMASPEWFHRDPDLAWGFYGHRLNLYRDTNPHDGFRKLLEAAQSKPGGYFVFTSNVDGHFQKAGFAEHRIEECHGSIHHLQCSQPCRNAFWGTEDVSLNVDLATFRASGALPSCANCGAIARPNILMFGDWNWVSARSDAQRMRLSRWLDETVKQSMKLAVIEIGAGKAVPTVRRLSEQVSARARARLIRINPRDYEVPDGHISMPSGALEGISRILQQ